MRQEWQHILFLATEYAAGMRPYANAIIHTLWQPGDHVLIVAKDDSVKHDFDDLPTDAVTWIDYPTSKLNKLVYRFKPTRLVQEIERLVTDHELQLIYCLTGELVLSRTVKRLQRLTRLLYTVHDAVGHDSKFESWASWLKHRILVQGPQQSIIRRTQCQITNSKEQLRQIKERYPYHKVYYAPFPSLVPDDIANGNASSPELKDVNGEYILFFGNVQLYKGVHVLYEAYLSHSELQNMPLVIAGAGYIYFKRQKKENGNIIFINRFIDDSEVKDLFSRAAVVVYPYISATQSGVTSIASYFGKPMVLSDLPFFKQTCEGYQGIEFFPTGDSEALATAIQRSLQAPETSTRPLYDSQYSTEALRTTLTSIITELLQPTN
ncbi:MAG: glycosyltransferase family 4 protein [Muribaculaceae bacterium]|nr:glycosyltransferase family 4 protein [Muribaculaceae bacterium]